MRIRLVLTGVIFAMVALGAIVWKTGRARAQSCHPAQAVYKTPPTPTTSNHIIYLHGRSMGYWPQQGFLGASTAWSHVWLNYNGSHRISDTTARTQIKTALKRCVGPVAGGGTQCVVACFSAGCVRYLYALNELKAEGWLKDTDGTGAGTALSRNSTTEKLNILWVEATASAAGGSELADQLSKKLFKFLAKVFGDTAPIDDDLKTGTLRNTTWTTYQNMYTGTMYHRAGSKDICQRILIFFKVCGNKYLKKGDGAVGYHSACGYKTKQTNNAGCCDSGYAKYNGRSVATGAPAPQNECTPYATNHKGMFAKGVVTASVRLGSSKTLACADTFSSTLTQADCNPAYEDCDGGEPTGKYVMTAYSDCGGNTNPDGGLTGRPVPTCTDDACDALSPGYTNTGGCGERGCRNASVIWRSYFQNASCTGREFSPIWCGDSDARRRTWDGKGMVGINAVQNVCDKSGCTPISFQCSKYGVCGSACGKYGCSMPTKSYKNADGSCVNANTTFTQARFVYRQAASHSLYVPSYYD